MNIYGFVEENSRIRPDKTAIRTKDARMSYSELVHLARALGTNLRKSGIGFCDHVTLMLPNVPEFIISYMATIGIGAVIVPVNPTYTSRELLHIIKDSESKAIIIEASNLNTFSDIKDQCALDVVITTGEGGNFSQWVNGSSKPILLDVDKDDVAAMVYSSGLTGYSMGAQLTHGNLEHNSDLMKRMMEGSDKETTLAVIPCFHSFSASINMLSPLRLGGTVYLMKRPDFKEIGQAVNNAVVNSICAVPTLFFGLVNHPDVQDVDYSHIHFMIAGGSALPLEVYNSFKEKFGIDIRQGYGITEASPVCSVNALYRPIKPESIGQPVFDVEARIVDDEGNILPPGEKGEILFRGPNIMKGYYKKPIETAHTVRDGWLYTGDLGYMDGEGYLYITGYKKEMVITSGFNVYCREVEMVLSEISGVKETAIAGVPDLMRGAIIKAYVVSDDKKLTEDDIKHYARKRLAPYKTPRIVVFVQEIPRDLKGRAILENLG